MQLIQTIDTNNLSGDYTNILESVCNTLYNLLANNQIDSDYSNNAQITIKYNIKKNIKNKKILFKHFEKYKRIKDTDELIINKKNCHICLQNYKIGEYKRNLHYCNHVFHRKCIDKWLLYSKNMECPLCRTSYCDIQLL